MLADKRRMEDFDMGLFKKKKKGSEVNNEITAEVSRKLDELAEKGNQLESAGRIDEALQAWNEALGMIPEPQQSYSETVWFLAAIGDIHFQRGEYQQSYECFNKARGNLSGGGYANPFVMLRLGESCLEIGDEKNATEYLLRAYMMEGKEIFAGEGDKQKYFEFLRTHVDIGE